MILAVDVHYFNDHAVAAGVLFKHWSDASESHSVTSEITTVAPYVSGQFYKRELPCILQLIEDHKLEPSHIIIDGFVFLDGVKKPGLGKYLFDALKGEVAVIGVAKTAFQGIPINGEVYRGQSSKPLYVSSVGIDLDKAKQHVEAMHGNYRNPSLLKRVDQLCRGTKP